MGQEEQLYEGHHRVNEKYMGAGYKDIRYGDPQFHKDRRESVHGEYIAEYEPNNKVAMAYEAFVEEYLRR